MSNSSDFGTETFLHELSTSYLFWLHNFVASSPQDDIDFKSLESIYKNCSGRATENQTSVQLCDSFDFQIEWFFKENPYEMWKSGKWGWKFSGWLFWGVGGSQENYAESNFKGKRNENW